MYGGVWQGFVQGKGRTDRPKDNAGPTSSGQMPASVRAAAMPRASISTDEPMTGSTCARACGRWSGCGNDEHHRFVCKGATSHRATQIMPKEHYKPWNISP